MNNNFLIKTIVVLFTFISCITIANEQHTETWQFPHYEESLVRQSQLLLYCHANPSRCPSSFSRAHGYHSGANGGRALNEPSATSTANYTSVVITGSDNDLNLVTEQSSTNDTIKSELTGDATIDSSEVLNIDQ